MLKTFNTIPSQRPITALLDSVSTPKDIKNFSHEQLIELANQLREFLLFSVGQSGGHFGAGLGVIELTVCLHYLLDTPHDKLIWDVGHQAYPHKILTGRRQLLPTIRQQGGLSPFPKRSESQYDAFGVGHSSTSISAALGMATGLQQQQKNNKIVAVIGDGALTAGMAFEALNHAGAIHANILIIYNDNDMSISLNVGALSKISANFFSGNIYTRTRLGLKKILSYTPILLDIAKRFEAHTKGFVVPPSSLFEAFGINYIGPIDGHNIAMLTNTIRNLLALEGPQVLHIRTVKGKGFIPAENNPIGYHALNKILKKPLQQPIAIRKKYSQIFGEWAVDMAAVDQKLHVITPAMVEGSGLVEFAKKFPNRCHDVGIAEQHAVTFAAGLAGVQHKPIVAIYSTFLQRAYDQVIHDVCLQNLDVTFAIDRAGFVGEDGPSHAGSFDIAFLRCIPNMVIMCPKDERQCRQMLSTAYAFTGPAAVRYPRGEGSGIHTCNNLDPWPMTTSEVIYQLDSIDIALHSGVIYAFGTLCAAAQIIGKKLGYLVINMCFVKPLDTDILDATIDVANKVTIEEGCKFGGAGSAINEYFLTQGQRLHICNLGIEDEYIEHGSRSFQLQHAGLTAEKMAARIAMFFGSNEAT